jgi:molybdenum cofactor cytidylyltransferase
MSAPALAAVLLAAGSASRFGSPKQLAEVQGTSLVRRAAEAVLECDAELLVVTGAHAAAVTAALDGLPLRLAHNASWELGMGESIGCGFRELRGQSTPPAAALLCLVDQPLVGAAQLRRLIERHRATPQGIVVSDHGEAVGPPCLFPAEYYEELSQLSGAGGARSVLQRHRQAVLTVAMPEAALDVDRPEDRQRVLELLQPGPGMAGARKPSSQ